MAHPKGFEPLGSAFGEQRTYRASVRNSANSLQARDGNDPWRDGRNVFGDADVGVAKQFGHRQRGGATNNEVAGERIAQFNVTGGSISAIAQALFIRRD
jgi:hypothetical protein